VVVCQVIAAAVMINSPLELIYYDPGLIWTSNSVFHDGIANILSFSPRWNNSCHVPETGATLKLLRVPEIHNGYCIPRTIRNFMPIKLCI